MNTTSIAGPALEEEPLLLSNHESESLFARTSSRSVLRIIRWKANPYWVIPIVLLVNIARGMTLSPRIKVYNDIACRAVGSPSPTHSLVTLLLSEDCKSAAVQARASKIQASILTIMNVLSSASTGLWSQWGDVKGRKIIFCLSIVGFIAMELVFILVSGSISAITSRGEIFILVGPVLEGLCGGLSVFNGVVHAYISDCTPNASRSKIFSTVQGMVFVGLAIGPWIGGIVFSFTNLTPYSLFYISIAIQLVLLVYIIFFPESLRSRVQPSFVELPPATNSPHKRSLNEVIKGFLIALVSPITIFMPTTVDDGLSSMKDYNLSLLGVGMFLYIVSTAVYPIKYLYGQHIYSWDPVHLGYYMSLLWISRAINLLVLLPVIISYFKPKIPATGASTPERVALELQFDKRLAQTSLSVDALADILVALSPASSQVSFIAFSCLSSFTSGGNPALHSLGAVCLHALGRGSETGRLFGAIGVLSAVAHSISPTIFAVTYSMTVSTYPKAIFCVAASLLLSAVLLLGRIRAKGW
ncbi:major facilitator superfamily domain-containing protein [Mycena vulgaris]|nr:major facilitator superfamily domain-containing protein [Mycena vulgaris]